MNIKNIKFSLKGTLTLKAKFSSQIDLKIPRKTVERVFKYTDSIKRCDKKLFYAVSSRIPKMWQRN